MDCNSADKLLMKFMDRNITKADEADLHAHIQKCAACKEAYDVYESMLDTFAEADIICAPIGFEMNVMNRIAVLEPLNVKNKYDALSYFLWSTVSILIGVGFIFALNRDAILAFLSTNENLSIYAELLVPVSAYAQEFTETITVMFNSAADTALNALSQIRYVMLALACVIGAVQFYLYRKDKVEA